MGSLATVFISSQSKRLNAWMCSLNEASRRRRKPLAANGPDTPESGFVARSSGGSGTAVRSENLQIRPLGGVKRAGDNAPLEAVVIDCPAGGSVGKGDRVLLAMVLALSLAFAYLSALVGSSDLLGCFLGGLAFSRVPRVRTVWGRQVRFGVSCVPFCVGLLCSLTPPP